jgi:hypothetical protein
MTASKHRKAHHLEEERVLFFFKNELSARKAILGAVYNLTSRVLAGVIAGIVAASIVQNTQQQQNHTHPTVTDRVEQLR